ncbi:MAG TPA: polysaccharide biosynthesis tyrosine autokinase [Candidatus Aminicenantes bacterium]|nr:polysaccharide biosynthesis tyrosine autokinase [Candidatus Aminicenantes bacterium]
MVQDTQQEAKPGLLALVQHYWRVLFKWKWTAGIFAFTCVAVAIAYSFLVPPVYTAVGTIWIEEGPRVLPFEEIQSFGEGSSLSSHTLLLTSRSLASNVIDKLKLSENPDFAGKPKPGLPPPDPADPIYREKLVQRFLSNVTVTAKGQSRLVDVSFSNRDPRLAADILNALFDGYVEMIVSKRYSTSEQATRYLNDQIAELRTEIEERERKLNEYGSRKDIMPLSTAEASTVARIGDYSRALTEAQLERINKLNYYNQLKNAPLGEIPSAPEGSVIERLREQYINLRRQYETRLNTVSPDYPDMRRMKSELDSATEALQNETQNLIRNALAEYQAALRKEQSLQNLLDGQKNQAYKASGDSVVFNSLKVELDSRKALLEALSKRQSETDVSARLKGLDSLTVWIVDKAAYPLKPSFPNKRKNALLGLLLGFAGGIGLAIGLEYLNNTVKTSHDVARETGIPLMGSIPAFESEAKPKGPRGEFRRIRSTLAGSSAKEEKAKKKRRGPESPRDPLWLSNERTSDSRRETLIELIAVREPQSIQAESFRSLRTALLVSSPPGRIKVILVTSPLAREGKSSTVSNLGVTLAEASKRVVIVDSDLRKPRQAKIFGVNIANAPGLSRYLSSNMDAAEIVKPTDVPNLHLVASGPLPANPIELLTSERMDGLVAFLKKSFDFVLFDTPPLLAVSDALAMGPMMDAIILVVRGGQTPVPALRQAKQKLDAHKLKCLGVILNEVDLVEQDGYYAKQYYSYAIDD